MHPYELVEVAVGVWAALSRPGAGSLGNAGIIDVGGATIVFDTGLTPRAGFALRRAADEIAPVRYVVLSHWHLDHCGGAPAFADVPIVATATTRQLIDERARANLERFREIDREPLFEERLRRAATSDAVTAAELRDEVADLRVLEETLEGHELALPTVTFATRVEIHGKTRKVVLRTFGGGHTASDLMLVVGDGEARVVFSGDLVVVRMHPFFDGGSVEDWLAAFEWIDEQSPAHIVPGHGLAGSPDLVADIRTYFDVVGVADPTGIPEQFEDWGFKSSYADNVEKLRSSDVALNAEANRRSS